MIAGEAIPATLPPGGVFESGAFVSPTSTGWLEAFVRWIGTHGMLKPAASGGGGAAN
jgi:hypothetical protein